MVFRAQKGEDEINDSVKSMGRIHMFKICNFNIPIKKKSLPTPFMVFPWKTSLLMCLAASVLAMSMGATASESPQNRRQGTSSRERADSQRGSKRALEMEITKPLSGSF